MASCPNRAYACGVERSKRLHQSGATALHMRRFLDGFFDWFEVYWVIAAEALAIKKSMSTTIGNATARIDVTRPVVACPLRVTERLPMAPKIIPNIPRMNAMLPQQAMPNIGVRPRTLKTRPIMPRMRLVVAWPAPGSITGSRTLTITGAPYIGTEGIAGCMFG